MDIHQDVAADLEGYQRFRQAVEQLPQADLWHLILGATTRTPEQLLVRESLIYALPPRTIYARHPDQFANVAEVYAMKCNLFKRLQHNQAPRHPSYEETLSQDRDT